MWTSPRPHHNQISSFRLCSRHDLFVDLAGWGNDKSPADSFEIGGTDLFQQRALEQFEFFFRIRAVRAMEQTQLGFVRMGQSKGVTDRVSGVTRQVSRAND